MRLFLLVCGAAILAGCGYVGDPLPPALNIPVAVTDLRAIQRGDKLVLDFTAPALTTDDIALTTISGAEVRVGEDTVVAAPPKPGGPAHIEVPVRPWVGREAPVRIVLSGPKGQKSQDSNAVILRISEPLTPPSDVKAEPHPEGIRVSWTSSAPTFRITREPAAEASVDKPEYIDRAVELGKEYKYTVVAVAGANESLPSATIAAVSRDTFGPAAPANLQAIAGVSSIELAWDRNSEADLKSYRVYRNDTVVAQDLDVPAFSDKQVMAGQRYRYAITAVDQRDNESPKSQTIEISAP